MRKIILRFLEKTAWWNRMMECSDLQELSNYYLYRHNLFRNNELGDHYSELYVQTINKFNSIKFWWMKSL